MEDGDVINADAIKFCLRILQGSTISINDNTELEYNGMFLIWL